MEGMCGAHTPHFRKSTIPQPLSHPMSHPMAGRRSYLRSNRQGRTSKHSCSSSSSWPLRSAAREPPHRRVAVPVSYIKAVKNNPFMRQLRSPLPPSPHVIPILVAREEEERIGERREKERMNMQQRTFMAPNFGPGGARENYGEKLALSPSPSLPPPPPPPPPLVPNDDWQAHRGNYMQGLSRYSASGCPDVRGGLHVGWVIQFRASLVAYD